MNEVLNAEAGWRKDEGVMQVEAAVTCLFVPGDRPERFTKAMAAGSDIIIIDLEDAVAPAAKAEALTATLAALSAREPSIQALVRINPLGAPSEESEVKSLLSLAASGQQGLLGLMLPKAEDGPRLQELAARCDGLELALVLLIESAAGILDAPALARIPGVTRLAFGAIDYALDIDAGSDDRFLDHARSALVVASRSAKIAAPLDSPSTYIRDAARVETEARLARGFGFGGKLCIHPAQVPVVAQAFVPGDVELAWALSVVSASDGASQVDGEMIDRPVIQRAHRVLCRAKKSSDDC